MTRMTQMTRSTQAARSLRMLMVGLVVAGGTLSCSGLGSGGSAETDLERQAQQLDRKAAELRDQEERLRSEARELDERRRELTSRGAPSSAPIASVGSDLLPPNPKPGECYARVVVPARYEAKTRRVLEREASEKIEVVPARYETGTEKVLVREATTELEVVPAVYETVTERILVQPASKKIVEVPATYKTVTERVLVKPAHTAWKKGTGIGVGRGTASAEQVEAFVSRFEDQKVLETRVEDTGEIMCLVEVPAQYEKVEKRVVDQPATTKTVEIAAEYRTVKKQVVKTPARTREIPVPPQYKTMKATKLVEPAREKRVKVPEKWKEVTTQTKVADERVEWRPVLCEVNMTRSNVGQLQSRLKKAGCYSCQVDGVMGRCTLDAMKCYCEPKGLPWGKNYVTTQCIQSMGLQF